MSSKSIKQAESSQSSLSPKGRLVSNQSKKEVKKKTIFPKISMHSHQSTTSDYHTGTNSKNTTRQNFMINTLHPKQRFAILQKPEQNQHSESQPLKVIENYNASKDGISKSPSFGMNPNTNILMSHQISQGTSARQGFNQTGPSFQANIEVTDTTTPNDSFYSKPGPLNLELINSRTSDMKVTYDSKMSRSPKRKVVVEQGGDNATTAGNWHNSAKKQPENFGNVYLQNMKSTHSDTAQASKFKNPQKPIVSPQPGVNSITPMNLKLKQKNAFRQKQIIQVKKSSGSIDLSIGQNKRNNRASSTLKRPKLKAFQPSTHDLKNSLEMVKLARGGQPVHLPNLRNSGLRNQILKSSMKNPLDDFIIPTPSPGNQSLILKDGMGHHNDSLTKMSLYDHHMMNQLRKIQDNNHNLILKKDPLHSVYMQLTKREQESIKQNQFSQSLISDKHSITRQLVLSRTQRDQKYLRFHSQLKQREGQKDLQNLTKHNIISKLSFGVGNKNKKDQSVGDEGEKQQTSDIQDLYWKIQEDQKKLQQIQNGETLSNTVGSQGEIKEMYTSQSEDDGQLAIINNKPKIGKEKTEKIKGLKQVYHKDRKKQYKFTRIKQKTLRLSSERPDEKQNIAPNSAAWSQIQSGAKEERIKEALQNYESTSQDNQYFDQNGFMQNSHEMNLDSSQLSIGKDTKEDKLLLSRHISIKSLEKGNYQWSSREESPLRMLSKLNSGALSGKLIRNDSGLRQIISKKGSQKGLQPRIRNVSNIQQQFKTLEHEHYTNDYFTAIKGNDEGMILLMEQHPTQQTIPNPGTDLSTLNGSKDVFYQNHSSILPVNGFEQAAIINQNHSQNFLQADKQFQLNQVNKTLKASQSKKEDQKLKSILSMIPSYNTDKSPRKQAQMMRLQQQKIQSFEQKHQLEMQLKHNITLDGGNRTIQFTDKLQRIKIKERTKDLSMGQTTRSPRKTSVDSQTKVDSKTNHFSKEESLEMTNTLSNIKIDKQRESARTQMTKTQKTFTNKTRTRNGSQFTGAEIDKTDSLNNDLLMAADEVNEKNSVFSKMQLIEKMEVREIAYKQAVDKKMTNLIVFERDLALGGLLDKNNEIVNKNSKVLSYREKELQRDVMKLNAGGGISNKFLKDAHSLKQYRNKPTVKESKTSDYDPKINFNVLKKPQLLQKATLEPSSSLNMETSNSNQPSAKMLDVGIIAQKEGNTTLSQPSASKVPSNMDVMEARELVEVKQELVPSQSTQSNMVPTMQDQDDPMTSKMELASKQSKSQSIIQSPQKEVEPTKQSMQIQEKEAQRDQQKQINPSVTLQVIESQIFNKQQSNPVLKQMSREALPLNQDLDVIADAVILQKQLLKNNSNVKTNISPDPVGTLAGSDAGTQYFLSPNRKNRDDINSKQIYQSNDTKVISVRASELSGGNNESKGSTPKNITYSQERVERNSNLDDPMVQLTRQVYPSDTIIHPNFGKGSSENFQTFQADPTQQYKGTWLNHPTVVTGQSHPEMPNSSQRINQNNSQEDLGNSSTLMDLQKVTPTTTEKIDFPQEQGNDYHVVPQPRPMTIEEKIGILTAKDIHIQSSSTSKKEYYEEGFTEEQLIEMLKETDLAYFNELNNMINIQTKSTEHSPKVTYKLVDQNIRSKQIIRPIKIKKKVPDLSNLIQKAIPSIQEVEDHQFTNRTFRTQDGRSNWSNENVKEHINLPKPSQEPKNYTTNIQNIELDDSILKDQKGNIYFERRMSDDRSSTLGASFPLQPPLQKVKGAAPANTKVHPNQSQQKMIDRPVNARLRDNQKRKTLLKEFQNKEKLHSRLNSTSYSKGSDFTVHHPQDAMQMTAKTHNSGSLFQSNMAQTFQEIKENTQKRELQHQLFEIQQKILQAQARNKDAKDDNMREDELQRDMIRERERLLMQQKGSQQEIKLNQFNYDGVKIVERQSLEEGKVDQSNNDGFQIMQKPNQENIGLYGLSKILQSTDNLQPPQQSQIDDYFGILNQLREQIEVQRELIQQSQGEASELAHMRWQLMNRVQMYQDMIRETRVMSERGRINQDGLEQLLENEHRKYQGLDIQEYVNEEILRQLTELNQEAQQTEAQIQTESEIDILFAKQKQRQEEKRKKREQNQ